MLLFLEVNQCSIYLRNLVCLKYCIFRCNLKNYNDLAKDLQFFKKLLRLPSSSLDMSSIMHSSLCQENGLKNSTEIAESNSSYPGSGSDVAVAVSIGTFLSLAIVVGNGLIIVSVAVVKKLRQPANYLIVSLALSDFLVGFIVLPLTIVNDSGNEWIFGSMMCDVHVSFDVICCTASIMNLCMISIDRWEALTNYARTLSQLTGASSSFYWCYSLQQFIGSLLSIYSFYHKRTTRIQK